MFHHKGESWKVSPWLSSISSEGARWVHPCRPLSQLTSVPGGSLPDAVWRGVESGVRLPTIRLLARERHCCRQNRGRRRQQLAGRLPPPPCFGLQSASAGTFHLSFSHSTDADGVGMERFERTLGLSSWSPDPVDRSDLLIHNGGEDDVLPSWYCLLAR